ncbi:MAG TPA: 7TM diverse intracellular signaling domain-containing protein, partial [Cytophagaceae bacterium]|nr:7TM diverse intracellular signaling domain-containing protein [Cytophagaceae bacterium]
LLYILSWMYSSMLADGTGFQYIWPELPSISKIGIYVSRPILLIVFVLYSLEFLKTNDIKILNKKYVLYSLTMYLLFYPIHIIFDLSLLHNTLFIIPFIIIFYYSIKSLRSGYKPARYFLLGNSVILLSVTLTLLKYNGLLDFLSSFWTLEIIIVYSTNIAMVIEIIILSFAMADRIKFFKIEKEKTQELLIEQLEENHSLSQKVNRELEEKVIERTQEIEEKSKQIEEANLKLQQQAIQINEMNARLDLDNWKLKKSIIEEKESRIKFKEISFDEFKQVYPNENICFQFLEELKWQKGYTCKRCGNDKYGKGNHQFSRRCTKCRYDESVTTDTIFHKCKFDINKALYIVVMVNRYGDKQSISELANELDLRVATCWNFAQKALKVRNSKEYAKLDDESKFRFLIQQEVNE